MTDAFLGLSLMKKSCEFCSQLKFPQKGSAVQQQNKARRLLNRKSRSFLTQHTPLKRKKVLTEKNSETTWLLDLLVRAPKCCYKRTSTKPRSHAQCNKNKLTASFNTTCWVFMLSETKSLLCLSLILPQVRVYKNTFITFITGHFSPWLCVRVGDGGSREGGRRSGLSSTSRWFQAAAAWADSGSVRLQLRCPPARLRPTQM